MLDHVRTLRFAGTFLLNKVIAVLRFTTVAVTEIKITLRPTRSVLTLAMVSVSVVISHELANLYYVYVIRSKACCVIALRIFSYESMC